MANVKNPNNALNATAPHGALELCPDIISAHLGGPGGALAVRQFCRIRANTHNTLAALADVG